VSLSAEPRGWLTLRRGAALLVLGIAAAAALAFATLAGGGSAVRAPSTLTRIVGAPAPGPLSGAGNAPVPAAASAARKFMSGYLAYLYGHAPGRQIEAATPHLIATIGRGNAPVAPAARRLRPVVVALGAREPSGNVLHITALVSDGIARYPVRFVMVHDQRGWETTALANPE